MANAECSASSSSILDTRNGARCCGRPYSQREQEFVWFINTVLKESSSQAVHRRGWKRGDAE